MRKPLFVFVVIAVSVVAVWALSAYVINQFFANWSPTVAGQIGDTFGAVNALFSGLAFSGIFYIVYLEQNERLGLTRRETTLKCYERLSDPRILEDWIEVWLHVSLGNEPTKAHLLNLGKLILALDALDALIKIGELDLPLAKALFPRCLDVMLHLPNRVIERSKSDADGSPIADQTGLSDMAERLSDLNARLSIL